MFKKLSLLVLVLGLASVMVGSNLFSSDPNAKPAKNEPLTVISNSDFSRAEDTIKYDGENAANGIGLTNGGTFWGAVRFTTTDACTLKSAIFFNYGAVSAPGMIYIHAAGTATAPGAKLDSISYTGATGAWVRVNFATPMLIPGGTDFWLNVRLTHVAGQYPFGVDAGPSVTPARSYVSTDGNTWVSLPSIPLNYNWNLRAIGKFVRLNNDVGVDAILTPGATHRINTPMIPSARVKNYGNNAQTNFSVVCSITGPGGAFRYTNTQTVASLASGATATATFTSWTPTVEEQLSVMMKTTLVGDEFPGNDRKTRNTQVAQELLSETFNDATFPPTGWQAVIGTGTYNWERSSAGTYPTCTPYEGDGMATYQSWYASSGNNARLISPVVTVTAPTICSLKFWMMHDPGYSTSNDRIEVQTSPTGAAPWTTLTTLSRYATTQAWTEHAINLGSMSSNFYLGFNAISAYGNNMYIDYVRVTGAAPANNDVGVDIIRAPGASHIVNTPMTPIALVKNYGTSAQTNFPVVCSIVGAGSVVRYTNTKTVASLAAGDTVRVNFDAWTPTISENTTVAMRTNLTGDANPVNDRKSRATIIGTIILQDFETTNGAYIADPPAGGWEWGTPTTVGPSAAYSGVKCWGTVLGANYLNSVNWKLSTPRYTASTNNPTLKFYHWYSIETRWDGGNVKMSTNGTTWSLIHPVGGYPDTARSANVAIPTESCYTGSMTTWTEATFNLPVNSGQNFWLRWHFGTDASVASYPGWYVDDVMLIGASAAVEEENPNQTVVTTLNNVKPNPVKGIAHISFNITKPTHASLKIYDASGRIVKTLVNSNYNSGTYNLTWNGKDDNNRAVAEGIYFYTLETDNNNITKKLVLTR